MRGGARAVLFIPVLSQELIRIPQGLHPFLLWVNPLKIPHQAPPLEGTCTSPIATLKTKSSACEPWETHSNRSPTIAGGNKLDYQPVFQPVYEMIPQWFLLWMSLLILTVFAHLFLGLCFIWMTFLIISFDYLVCVVLTAVTGIR